MRLKIEIVLTIGSDRYCIYAIWPGCPIVDRVIHNVTLKLLYIKFLLYNLMTSQALWSGVHYDKSRRSQQLELQLLLEVPHVHY